MEPAVVVESVTTVVEVVGIAIVLAGVSFATIRLGASLKGRTRFEDVYATCRREVGQAILLGLELLIAADLIETVTVSPTPTTLMNLAAIVLIRTFLSLALTVEIEGRWPWKARSASGETTSGIQHPIAVAARRGSHET